MDIIKYADTLSVEEAMKENEPLLALISFDLDKAIVSHIDEAMEHHILLAKLEMSSSDIDKYFRIVFDKNGADWTFICPPDYKQLSDKTRRIAEFYKDGFVAISTFLSQIGYLVDINIPKRYRRHFDDMSK